jgi:hypothetical protein
VIRLLHRLARLLAIPAVVVFASAWHLYVR